MSRSYKAIQASKTVNKKPKAGSSPVVEWLGFSAFTALQWPRVQSLVKELVLQGMAKIKKERKKS